MLLANRLVPTFKGNSEFFKKIERVKQLLHFFSRIVTV